MKRSCLISFLTLIAFVCVPSWTQGAWILKDGLLVEVEAAATMSPEEHYDRGVLAWEHEDWDNVIYQFKIVIGNFPGFVSKAPEIFFYTGVAYYNLGELDFADREFRAYLRQAVSPEFLEETMEFKFAIAEQFRNGARQRMFGSTRLPKWSCGKETAIKLYDEIVSTLPCHDLASQSLFSKGCLLCELQDYSGSVDAFQGLIRRFPLHELAPDAYLAILQVYLDQARCEYQNSDILALAEIVLRHFREDFPNEERVAEAESDLTEIKEIYAYGLYATGEFYERTSHPQASVLYYCSAIQQFPETPSACNARRRLTCLTQTHPCLNVPAGVLDAAECL